MALVTPSSIARAVRTCSSITCPPSSTRTSSRARSLPIPAFLAHSRRCPSVPQRRPGPPLAPPTRALASGRPSRAIHPASRVRPTSPLRATSARRLATSPKTLPTGYVQSYHLTVQRQLSNTTTFEVAYVGEHGVKLQVLADLNQSVANAVTATCNPSVNSGCLSLAARRPIPTFTTIEESLSQGFLTYNGLQSKIEHRTGHGLYLLNSFTWSRALDNASGHLDTPDGDNSRINLANPLGERGPSAYNQPLNDILSIVYDLPYGRGRMFGSSAPFMMQELLGGWQVTAINSASSGLPVNITYSPNSFQQVSPLLVQRPNLIGNPVIPKNQRIKIAGNQDLVALQNPVFGVTGNAALSLPDVNHPYGSAGRNSVRFDPFYQLDLGLHKNFPLRLEGHLIRLSRRGLQHLQPDQLRIPSERLQPHLQQLRHRCCSVHLPGAHPAVRR